MKKPPRKKPSRFRTNVLLKNIVGKDLINDDNIAVLELVKNSFDAGSPSTKIIFKFLKPVTKDGSRHKSAQKTTNSKEKSSNQKAEIIIADEGSGMSIEDINDKWLNIAFSEKKYSPKKGVRFQAGSKGVGRFSCDRLGKYLDLFTRQENGKLLHLYVDWTKFEVENKPNLEIQKIPVELNEVSLEKFQEITGLSSLNKGTVLRITGPRSQWNRTSLISLRRYLERLLNPNQIFERDLFEIWLLANDYEEEDKRAAEHDRVNGKIDNLIFQRLEFKTTNIESEIDKDGEFITTTLRHDGNIVYRIIEKNIFPKLESAKIVIYFLNPYKKAYFKRQTGLDAVEFGSIFLFVNGFRVPPYGDRGNDWLGLDIRKTQGYARYISTRDILGRVEVTDLEEKFQTVSSREGLVHNEAYEQLTNGFYFRTHTRLEAFVVDGLNWDSVPENIRKELRSADGKQKWNENNEQYDLSKRQKIREVGKNLISILNTDPRTLVSIDELNVDFLNDLVVQQNDDLQKLLTHFDKYESSVINAPLAKTLKDVKKVVEKQERQIKKQKQQIIELSQAYNEIEQSLQKSTTQIEDLKVETATREQELLFLKSVTTFDENNLVNFIHQIGINSGTIKNLIDKLLGKLSRTDNLNPREIVSSLEAISLANQKILAVTQFATKAGFKFQSQTISADLSSFIEQYLLNVSKDFTGAGLTINVLNQTNEEFKIKFKPIEVTIVLDNLLSNAKKAGAKEVWISMQQLTPEILEILFTDNGKGFDTSIKN